jgi:isoquinoline 1-oxidoreductase
MEPARTPSGRGVGVACAIYLGTYVATMAEVSLDKTTGGTDEAGSLCTGPGRHGQS